jgi:hypothetical protein
LTGGSDGEAESIASNEDKGGDENGMDDEEEEDAGAVEEGVNPSTAPPPNISGNLYKLPSGSESLSLNIE